MQGVEPAQQREEEKCVAGSRSGKGRTAQPFEIRHGTTGLEFALLGFGLNIGPQFPQCFSFLPFGRITHSLPYCRLEVCNLPFDFTGTYNKEIFLSLRIDFGL